MSELTTLKRYGVYHPVEGVNDTCSIEVSYKYVTTIEAENLIRSLYMANSKLNVKYKELGIRDTERGDIIAADDRVYMVISSGFKKISKNKPLYKEIMETDEAIIEILSRKSLTQEDIDDLIENSI